LLICADTHLLTRCGLA